MLKLVIEAGQFDDLKVLVAAGLERFPSERQIFLRWHLEVFLSAQNKHWTLCILKSGRGIVVEEIAKPRGTGLVNLPLNKCRGRSGPYTADLY